MLDLIRRQGNLKTKAIAYNHGTTQLRVTGTEEIDKAAITSLRASGSTNFVAVFKNLANIFDAESKDSSKSYFVFFMTDGLDTCNEQREIMAGKKNFRHR